jgi:hypothetical protein
MTRRNLIALLAAGAAGASAADGPQKSLFELRILRLRTGPENQRQRCSAYLKSYVALAKLAGAGPIGVFSSSIGEDTPYLMVVTSFKGYADMDACQTKLRANPDHAKALAEWYAGARPFERQEVRLLAAFPGFPVMTPPPTEGRKASRIFEFRTYELDTSAGLERKIKMFEVGETAAFIRAGMVTVFFGETVFGQNTPTLSYMVGYDDLAARDAAWRAFGADPEWKKLGAQFPDVAAVPKLSNAFLSPLPFSDVR